MKLAFAGTPEFAASALRALLAAKFDVALVLSQPDRPAGRGQRQIASPVKQLAQEYGIAVAQPEKLRDPESHAPLLAVQADVLIVAAYGLILPQAVLDIPPYGCINIHASLLPRWRGAAPIQRCIEAGDEASGITIMRMDSGLDTGPMLLRESLPLAADETAASLHDKLAQLGARLIVDSLHELDRLQAQPQPQQGISYANKIDKSEAVIDWSQPALQIERRLRAFDPFPGCVAQLDGKRFKLWRGQVCSGTSGRPGEIIALEADGMVVACGQGALKLTQLQQAGGRRLAAAEFLRGFSVGLGQRLT